MHEQSFTIEQDGKYRVISGVTLQALSDVDFDSEEAANKWAKSRSFDFGLKLDEAMNRHGEAKEMKRGTVQHGTSLLDGDY